MRERYGMNQAWCGGWGLQTRVVGEDEDATDEVQEK